MRPVSILLVASLYWPIAAIAQTPTPAPAAAARQSLQFEGITLGEPLVELIPRLGDPTQIASTGNSTIWRYLEGGGGYYLDLLVRKNVAGRSPSCAECRPQRTPTRTASRSGRPRAKFERSSALRRA